MAASETAAAARIDREREGKRGGGRGARKRPAPRAPEPWEFELLRLIAEQGAIPFDQLARFVGCDQPRAARLAKHLFEAGFADYGRFLYDEPHWVWLTGRGTRLSGTGFSYLQPRIGAMARMRAVNEIRLHIAARAPQARWLCARSVVREQGKRGHRPNAVVEIGSERHALIVVLRTPEQERLRGIVETHMGRYDAVIAFAELAPRRALERLAKKNHWPKLVVRAIPEP
jgi:hypothetical protein